MSLVLMELEHSVFSSQNKRKSGLVVQAVRLVNLAYTNFRLFWQCGYGGYILYTYTRPLAICASADGSPSDTTKLVETHELLDQGRTGLRHIFQHLRQR
jgi:hypothetical protein